MQEKKHDSAPTEFREQFSKRLARWTAVFWFLYMTWLSVIFILEPTTALYNVYMGLIATIVMIVNVWAYTRNSIFQKAVMAMLDRTKLELSLNAHGGNPSSAKSKNGSGDDDDSDSELVYDEETEEDEGGGNG